jgi:transcription antitermination protein NusB
MSLPQQKFREIVFQILYCQDFGDAEEADVESFLMPILKVTKKAVRTAGERVSSITPRLAEIDDLIAKNSQSYSFERISRVEKNVLRLGLYELLFDESLPPKVAISEAIRLCRKFGTRESAGFINAVLDSVHQQKAVAAVS